MTPSLDSFGKRLAHLIDELGMNANSFSREIGEDTSRITYLIRKEGNPSIELVAKILDKYRHISPDWLILGEGSMNRPKVERSSNATGELYVVTVDQSGDDVAMIVTAQARAGYIGGGYADPTFLEDLPIMSMPDVKGREKRAFEVVGDSMEPTFYERDIVGCTRIYSLADLRYGNCHVIVTRADGILLKRVVHDADENYLSMRSDNLNYPLQRIHKADIMEIWYPRRKYSAQMPAPANTDNRIYELERNLFRLQRTVSRLSDDIVEEEGDGESSSSRSSSE